METLKYPAGRFQRKDSYTPEELKSFIEVLRKFPEDLASVTKDITDKSLNTPYRPDGWTALQVIHHVADSHSQMLTRLKWTLTEDTPTIKAYHEDLWAQLSDYSLPFQVSVDMCKGIHAKIVNILENLDDAGLSRQYMHPESGKLFDLKTVMALYAWHCAHHLAHIQICKKS